MSAGPPSSGLRDPAAAVRGFEAAALLIEAVILLLALAPLAKVGGTHRAAAIWFCLAVAVLTVVLAGMRRRRWAWPAAAVVPLALIVGGVLHWMLALAGVLFGAVWFYVWYVRRRVLYGPGPSGESPNE
jgi:Protein of unknown function (DUF4233)